MCVCVLALKILAQSVGAVEYIGCLSAEGQDLSNECPGYNAKQSQPCRLGL